MGILLAQAVLAYDTGLPEDVAVNTWHFQFTDPLVSGHLDDVEGLLNDFYGTNDPVTTRSVASFLPGTIEPAQSEYRYYDLGQPTPRAPARIDAVTWTNGPSGDPLPEEVALCLSYQAVQVSGEPQARRRGRAFIGPLSDGALGAPTDRPSGTLVNTLIGSANRMLTDSIASTTRWVVYSRTTVPPTGFNVDNGWVDNAFDTQRRRGIAPTLRTVFP